MYLDSLYQYDILIPNHHARHRSQHELYPPKYLPQHHLESYLSKFIYDDADLDAVVVIAGVGLFAFVWWWAGARKYCTFQLGGIADCRYWTERLYTYDRVPDPAVNLRGVSVGPFGMMYWI